MNRKSSRQFITSFLFALLLIVFSGCQANEKKLIDVKFVLSWSLQGVDAPLLVAIDKKYFLEEGLNVSFDRGMGSADSVTKVGAGRYDLGYGDINSMIEFNVKNPSEKAIAVSILYNKLPMGIIALKKSGVETPKQLAGKQLGAPAGSATRKFFPLFAKFAELDPNSVTWVSIDSKLQETMLIQERVAGVAGYTTAVAVFEKLGINPKDLSIFYYNDYGLDLYGNGVLVKASFAKENPELIRAFLRAYNKGMLDTVKDPNEAIEIMAKIDPLLDKQLERSRLQNAIDNLWVTQEVKRIGFGDVDPVRLEKAIDQVVEGFGLTSTPSTDEVFDGSFLPPLQERLISQQ